MDATFLSYSDNHLKLSRALKENAYHEESWLSCGRHESSVLHKEAEAHIAESRQILLSGEILLEDARTQVAWGLLCRDHGDLA